MTLPQAPRRSLVSHPRTARIAISGGNVAGVCIFLTEEDLRELNINPYEIHYVRYSIDVETRQLELAEDGLSEEENGLKDQ